MVSENDGRPSYSAVTVNTLLPGSSAADGIAQSDVPCAMPLGPRSLDHTTRESFAAPAIPPIETNGVEAPKFSSVVGYVI
jgi:hypothetical protein